MANHSSFYFTTTAYVYIFTSSIDVMVAIPVNSWVLWLIISGKRRLIETELLTFNLIITEVMCCVLFGFSLLRPFYSFLAFECFANFHAAVAVAGRVLFQCHICVDRYLAVVHPLVFIKYKHVKFRGPCLAVLWLVLTCVGVLNILFPFHPVVVSTLSFSVLAPALSIEIYCSLSMLRILRKPGPGDRETQEKKEGNQQKKRAAKIICIILAMLILNGFPFIVVPALKHVPVGDLFAIAFTISTFGRSVQAFLFLSRSGKLTCKL